ncbi:MAG: hypothetical protein P1U56_20880, partial [Saprospiraceae bacterium]|nr:hypothetical protein [Saprospiraceae bacterium]
MLRSKQMLFFCALALIFTMSNCTSDSESLNTQEIGDQIELRNSEDCCAEITGPSTICTEAGSSPTIFCANSCCEEAEYVWSGHPSIDGLTTRCINASGLDESVTEIHVQVKCPIDFGDLPDLPGDITDYCIAETTKNIKVCSQPTFSHPNPPLELSQVCFRTVSCFDFSSATCFTNINIIDHHPGLIVSAIGSEICIKAKFCSKENPFVGFVELQFEGPCENGAVVIWDNIMVGGSTCPDCANNPVGVDC